MIDIVQIYKYNETYNKGTYTTECRKMMDVINPSFESKNGYLDDGKLIFPIEF